MDAAQAAVSAADDYLKRGEPLLAYNSAQLGLQQSPQHPRLRQLQALALARSGDVGRANAILTALLADGVHDSETLGMLARTHKDLGLSATGTAQRLEHLRAAFDLYERAYLDSREASTEAAAYTGINAAAMAVLLGDIPRSRALAAEVRETCLRSTAARSAPDYWMEATVAEAALILGDFTGAAAQYARAAKVARRRYGDMSSTRRQARLLAAHLPGAPCDVADALAVPPVLAFTGHMIDQPERPAPRFPASLEPTIREALRARFAAIAPLAAYGSAACGADILCLEIAGEMRAETHIVLPFPAEEFRRTSVDLVDGGWGARFERALALATTVTVASDHRARDSAATFDYANLILTGMARLRAQVLDTDLRGLALCDPAAERVPGGSASIVAVWKARGLPVDHVVPSQAPSGGAQSSHGDSAAPRPATRHEMRAMLFADAVGYSQLSEDQIPSYISGFLGAVAELSRRTSHRFEHVETAGDGLYMVFRQASDAAHYALELSELVNSTDWTAHGLPSNLNLRIALHSGPVHCATDPITGLPIYTGPHTSRTARIEPITPPGLVYASSAFAAIAAAAGVEGLAMSYVGRIPLAKSHGTLGLYSVRSAGATKARKNPTASLHASPARA